MKKCRYRYDATGCSVPLCLISHYISLSAGVEDRVQYWQARWATGQSQWHSDQPHKYLVKVNQFSNAKTMQLVYFFFVFQIYISFAISSLGEKVFMVYESSQNLGELRNVPFEIFYNKGYSYSHLQREVVLWSFFRAPELRSSGPDVTCINFLFAEHPYNYYLPFLRLFVGSSVRRSHL